MVLSPAELHNLHSLVPFITQWVQQRKARGAADSLAELVTAGGSQAMHKALKQTYARTYS